MFKKSTKEKPEELTENSTPEIQESPEVKKAVKSKKTSVLTELKALAVKTGVSVTDVAFFVKYNAGQPEILALEKFGIPHLVKSESDPDIENPLTFSCDQFDFPEKDKLIEKFTHIAENKGIEPHSVSFRWSVNLQDETTVEVLVYGEKDYSFVGMPLVNEFFN